MTLVQTPLHDRHVALGAKTGGFAGWNMPLEYRGVRAEHTAVRTSCGVFDVSHMGQVGVTGPGAAGYLGAALTNDIDRLSPGDGQYTLVCREDGGTIDDLIVYRLGADAYLVVCNASNVAPVVTWLTSRAPDAVAVTDRSPEFAMLAVQGPAWESMLGPLVADPGVFEMEYFQVRETEIAGAPCLVARTGYTGEPGVEIMCPGAVAGVIWDGVTGAGATPAGLAARDTLRMEMGYPLYGNELSLERTPIEAGLKWACDLEGGFVGADVMRRQVAEGLPERLCMLRLDEPGIPRTGCTVHADGAQVGVVTSGTLSPSLGVGIGMAYVRSDLAAPGTQVQIDIRGKRKAATTAKRPLVDTSPKED